MIFFATDNRQSFSLFVGSVPFSNEHFQRSKWDVEGAASPPKWLEKGEWHTLHSAAACSKGQGLHSKAPTISYTSKSIPQTVQKTWLWSIFSAGAQDLRQDCWEKLSRKFPILICGGSWQKTHQDTINVRPTKGFWYCCLLVLLTDCKAFSRGSAAANFSVFRTLQLLIMCMAPTFSIFSPQSPANTFKSGFALPVLEMHPPAIYPIL